MDVLLCFLGGMFLSNGVPHLVQGVSGRGFPTPFAKPPGKGESSSLVNVIWGAANLVAGCLLLAHVDQLDARSLSQMATIGAGALLMAVFAAWHFGAIYGGRRVRS